MKLLKYKIISSPVGPLKLVVDDKNLIAILWDNDKINRVRLTEMIEASHDHLLLKTEKQLNEYFSHQRDHFDLPIETRGTPFQQEVWEVLNRIPYGKTYSYQEVALKINRPRAVRAVGTAIGRNPISIIVPCHRVIGTNGSLTGFAGGLPRKKLLLDLEKPEKNQYSFL